MTVARGWFPAALVVVIAVTAARIVALAFDRTDLFLDESQYWLWGQSLDFGYYSKPPLIGWVIRAVTAIAGSDSPFWVRMPGAVFHGLTALVLGALAAMIWGARTGFWTAVSYATVPFAALGSLFISTDTILAPFYAIGLWAWFRLAQTHDRRWLAVLAGCAVGLAFLAKYVALYFLLSAGLAALLDRDFRVGWRNAALLLLSFGLVISPNIIWNLTHDLTTVSHTVDNVGWLRKDSGFAGFNLAGLTEFVLDQFVVVGPILFAALLAAIVLPVHRQRALLCFALPALVVVSTEAFLARAYANWALAAYFAGLPLAVALLCERSRPFLWASVAINGAIAVILPLLTILAPWPERNGAPLLKRYLGRAELSHQIAEAARLAGADAVYATERGILADLFYSERDGGLRFYAPVPNGRPKNYYEQMHPLPATAGKVFYVLTTPPVCDGAPVAPVTRFETAGGAHSRLSLGGYVLPEGCNLAN